MSTYQIEESDFETVQYYWRKYLWPERKSPIEETSWIDQTGKINPQMQFAKTYFWCIKDANSQKIVGVISGTDNGALGFRSRGIWVDPDHRKHGLGKKLMEVVISKALSLGHKNIWTMPRESALPFYERLGFINLTSVEGFEYGPHHIAQYAIEE